MRSDFLLDGGTDPQALAGRWRAAWRAAPDASPFLSWNWISAWLRATGARPMLLRAPRRDGGEALGLLARAPGSGERRVFALNEAGDAALDTPFIEHNGLAGWGADDAGVAGLARFLADARRSGPLAGWDELRLSGVPRDWAGSFAAAGLRVVRRAEQPAFAVDLAALRGAGGDLLSTLGPATRRQIRRARELYAGEGELGIDRAAGIDARREAMDCLRALHQARWQAAGHPGAFASPAFRAHVTHLVAGGAETGEAELLRVRVGGRTIGVLLNLVAGGTVASYVSGFARERDNRLKPGLVCHAMAIERHLAEGRTSYDLLAGDARYKRSLAAPVADLVWLSVFPNALSALRAAGRRALHRWRAAPLSDDAPAHRAPPPPV